MVDKLRSHWQDKDLSWTCSELALVLSLIFVFGVFGQEQSARERTQRPSFARGQAGGDGKALRRFIDDAAGDAGSAAHSGRWRNCLRRRRGRPGSARVERRVFSGEIRPRSTNYLRTLDFAIRECAQMSSLRRYL